MVLAPLGESEIQHYVASTLCRPIAEIEPLSVVIQAKTQGNPFYMREMLGAAYRSRCIWYEYQEARWVFDLDKLFEQFKSEHDYDFLDNDFVTRRLSELPPASRSLLAWASLVGTSFSFQLICTLLELDSAGSGCLCSGDSQIHNTYSKEDAVEGLQAAISAYIIVQGETDDRFRFTHDRYVQAASSLRECNKTSMHYHIAQTFMKLDTWDSRSRDSTASHICESLAEIKRRVQHRQPFRKHLMDCASAAVESGARPTAAKYFCSAIELLQQPNPWEEENEDVSYEETLQLHLRAAECYVYMDQHIAAHRYLDAVFENARSSNDKAPAWLGAKQKLVYISPEQTGRMPAEPDTRTDIYSLGILFWQLLTQQPVFQATTPLDIIQCVLGKRIPLVSSTRLDAPEVLAKMIQKCTSKNIQDRYHSVSGLRHDLQGVKEHLAKGDNLALKAWNIASRDVSSFFM